MVVSFSKTGEVPRRRRVSFETVPSVAPKATPLFSPRQLSRHGDGTGVDTSGWQGTERSAQSEGECRGQLLPGSLPSPIPSPEQPTALHPSHSLHHPPLS